MNDIEMLREALDLHERDETFSELMYGDEAVADLDM